MAESGGERDPQRRAQALVWLPIMEPLAARDVLESAGWWVRGGASLAPGRDGQPGLGQYRLASPTAAVYGHPYAVPLPGPSGQVAPAGASDSAALGEPHAGDVEQGAVAGQPLPCYELREVLTGAGERSGGFRSALDAFRHWEGCSQRPSGLCRRCRDIERRALRFVDRWGLLGVAPASSWRGTPQGPAHGFARWEPLDVFLVHACRLGGWLEWYWRWRMAVDNDFFAHHRDATLDALLDGLRAPEGRYFHPGLHHVLADARPRLRGDALCPCEWQYGARRPDRPAGAPRGAGGYCRWGPEACARRTAIRFHRFWDFPTLWVALHLELDVLVRMEGGRQVARCQRQRCGRFFTRDTQRERGQPRRYCCAECSSAERTNRGRSSPRG